MNLKGHQFFGNVQHVPGMGFVQLGAAGAPNGQVGNLGDEASVMMISGLGADTTTVAQGGNPNDPNAVMPVGFDLGGLLSASVDIFGIKVPVWLFVVAAGGLTAFGAWYLFLRKK